MAFDPSRGGDRSYSGSYSNPYTQPSTPKKSKLPIIIISILIIMILGGAAVFYMYMLPDANGATNEAPQNVITNNNSGDKTTALFYTIDSKTE